MIKNSELIGTKVPMPYGWREFKVGDLFDLKNTKAYTKLPDEMIVSSKQTAKVPFITTQYDNNGIAGLSELPPLNCGNRITYSDTTTGDAIFYQVAPYIGRSHVIFMEPKFNTFNKAIALFIMALIRKQTSGHFNYGKKLNKNAMNNIILKLPVTVDNNPDYKWMMSYIHALEELHIHNMSNCRLAEQNAYLRVTGLADNILSPEEKVVLEQWRQHEKFGGGTCY